MIKINTGRVSLNVVFNCIGSGWQGILTLIVTPFQVYFLGIEAYGIIGLLALLQVLVNSLDFGLSATVTKLVASNDEKEDDITASLISLHFLYWLLAFFMFAVMLFGVEPISNIWIKSSSSLSADVINNSVLLIACFLGARYPVIFYTGVMNGLQLMGMQNAIKVTVQTLRLGGGLGFLAYDPSIETLLKWYFFTAIFELIIFILFLTKKIPFLFYFRKFSIKSLRYQWKYSAEMYVVSLSGLFLGQLDRIAVSQFLTLENLGIYSIVYNFSILISLIQVSVNTASFSAFVNSFTSINKVQNDTFIHYYEYVNGLMVTLVSFPCIVVIFFSGDILSAWINDNVATQGSFCLVILSIGFFLNAVVSNSYTAFVASGNPRFPLYINLIGMIWYLPTVYYLVDRYGIDGASIGWLLLNLYYVFTIVPLAQIKIIKRRLPEWIYCIFGINFIFPFIIVAIFKGIFIIVGPGVENLIYTLVLIACFYFILVYKKIIKSRVVYKS